jgi:hypothetical protein
VTDNIQSIDNGTLTDGELNSDANERKLRTLVRPIAASTYIFDPFQSTDVWVTNETLFPPWTSSADSPLLDSSGLVTTGADGKIAFNLSKFVNFRDGLSAFQEPVNLFATPQTATPCYVTITHQLIPNPVLPDLGFSDVLITAFSWTPAGEPAPGVPVYWRCRAVPTCTVCTLPEAPTVTADAKG